MSQFLHLIPAAGWRVRIFDPTRYQGPIDKDIVAFALRRDGAVIPLIGTPNGIQEVPTPTALVDVYLLGPSDEVSSEIAQPTGTAETSSKAPRTQSEPPRTDASPPQPNREAIPNDTRPIEIRILEQIDSSEHEIDRGMDTERLICRCHGNGDILETIERLRAEHLIFVDPVEHRGSDFYRLTDKARAMLRDFRNTQQTCL
jgi:hypothetical protein